MYKIRNAKIILRWILYFFLFYFFISFFVAGGTAEVRSGDARIFDTLL
jgi:hypothetical protein